MLRDREVVFLLLALAASIALNPVGYVGGGGDDYHYLTGARCWAEGPCVGDTHWSTRWPLLAPASLFLPLTWVVPVGYSIAFVLCIAALGNAVLGRPVGLIAAGLVILMPAASTNWTTLGVDIPEATWLLLGALILVTRPKWTVVAGLCFGMAVATRVTAFVAIPAFVFLLVIYKRQALSFALGALVPIAGDVVLNWALTGDPLHRYSTALAHTTIHSEALSTGTDDGIPILNARLIGNWGRLVSVHWTVDPLINLAINPKAGIAIVMGLLCAPLAKPSKTVAWIAAIAFGWFVGLAYVLALDPSPRVMLMPLVLAQMAFASILYSLWTQDKKLVVYLIAGIAAITGLFLHYTEPRIWPVKAEALRWIAQGPVETTETVRRHFVDSPELQTSAPRSMERIQGACQDGDTLDLKLQRQILGLPAEPYRLCGR